jgi:hypothetical protein
MVVGARGQHAILRQFGPKLQPPPFAGGPAAEGCVSDRKTKTVSVLPECWLHFTPNIGST